MGRKAHANYIEVGTALLQELGGGPVPTKTLVAAAQEKDLIPDGKWAYHNFSRKLRESPLFDTSVRGQISFLGGGVAQDVAQEAVVDVPERAAKVPFEFPKREAAAGE